MARWASALALSILVSGFTGGRAAFAQASGVTGGFLELSDVFFAEGDRIFGPGQTIAMTGSVPSIPSYLCPPNGDGEDRFDFFPSADLYVIENQPLLGPFAPLNDVLGTPNRVIGTASLGAFVDEVVAITMPRGNLPKGTYDVVMDQCEDGTFQPGIDIHLGAGPGFAFEVFIPEAPGEIDLSPLKLAAQKYLLSLDGFELPVPIALPPGDTIEKVPGFCSGFKDLVQLGKLLNQVPAGLASAAAIAIEQCNDLVSHYKGLKADPPDPNFTAFAELGAIPYEFFSSASAFERALLRVSNIIVEQEALTEAFLTTLERVQGAQEASDHEFLSLQLRHLNELINLMVGPGGNLLRFFAALEALDRAVRDEPLFAGAAEADDFLRLSRGMRRAIAGIFLPLGPRFKREPSNPNILIPFGLQSFVIVYLGLDPFLNTAGLFSIAQFRASVGLPPIDFQHPTAQTTGPYTAPPGRDVSFDGGPSEDPNGDPLTFAWDLDMDGLFDDANTELVDQPFAEPGTRLVGLRVSDPAGNSDVSYVQLKIGDTLVQDIIALQQYRPRNLRRVAPDGTATTIAENIMPGRPVALQLDTNGDVFALQRPRSLSTTSPFLFHFDPAGNLLDTLSLDQLIALIGRDVGDVIDIVMDGRGNLLLSANEHEPDPIFGFLGPLMVVRLDRGFTQASVLVDGLKRSGVSASSLAIDPEGKIVISDLGDPDGDTGFEGLAGVSVLDPEDGSVTQVVPATNVRFPGGDTQIVQQLFGGVNLNLLGSNAGGPRGDGGIAVDGVGNYIVGTGQAVLPLDLWRIPFPPEVTELGRFGFKSNVQVVLGLEIFPLLISAPGTLNLDFSDIGIDAGGDYLVVGRNTGVAPPFNHNGVWRISPASEVFLVADLGEVVLNQTGFVFDVTRDVREVTPRDIPAPPVVPELRLDTLEVDQAACPLSATVRATLTNTGAGAVEDPITVFFFDDDPLQDGAVIGTATAQTPIAPNAAVALSIEWPDPGPGVHQVFALAQGTNTPFTAIMVCVPAPPEEAILLQPPGATLPVGETHTVTASVLDLLGNPIPGLDLSFSVTGANSALGTATTGADGTAVFSYTGGNAGQDSVIASVFDEISNAVSALWEQAATALTCDVDGDADVDIADINLIFAARGSAAGPGDARDLDGDGLITINDARGCVLQCTKARCAP